MKLDGNPCQDCPDQGCGKHAQCEKYLAFYEENRERDRHRIEYGRMNEYTKTAIEKMKSGRHCTGNRYRPKGRW